MKSTLLENVTPSSPVDVLQPFGGKYCIYTDSRTLCQEIQQEINAALFRKMTEPLAFSHLSSSRKDLTPIYCVSSSFLRSCMARRHANVLQIGDEEKWLDIYVHQNDLPTVFQ
jgi:hypothetical protein